MVCVATRLDLLQDFVVRTIQNDALDLQSGHQTGHLWQMESTRISWLIKIGRAVTCDLYFSHAQ